MFQRDQRLLFGQRAVRVLKRFWGAASEVIGLPFPRALLLFSRGSVSIIRYCKYHRRRHTPSSLFMQSLPPSHLSFTLLSLVNAQSPSRCHHLSDHHHVNTLASWLPHSSSIDTTSPLSAITHFLHRHCHHPSIRYWLLLGGIFSFSPETWLPKIENGCSWAVTAVQWLRSERHMGRGHEVNGRRKNGLLMMTFKGNSSPLTCRAFGIVQKPSCHAFLALLLKILLAFLVEGGPRVCEKGKLIHFI